MWLEAEGGQEGGFLDPLGRKIGTNQLPGRQVANCMWRGWGNVQGTGTGRITPVWTLFAPPGQWVDGHVPSWGGGALVPLLGGRGECMGGSLSFQFRALSPSQLSFPRLPSPPLLSPSLTAPCSSSLFLPLPFPQPPSFSPQATLK